MRWILVLALLCSVAGCRRSAPPEDAPAPTAEPTAATSAPAPVADAAPAAEPAVAIESPAPLPGPLSPARFGGERGSRAEPAHDASTSAEPAKEKEEEDRRIYSWVDREGVVHYGTADEVPDDRRRSARVVESGVTVVSPEHLEALPPVPVPGRRAEEEAANASPAARSAPGPEPELDAQGLPIPGTMQDTAATQAAKAAGETQIDPAAVERRRQQELRDMNCKEKDGVWYCG